MMKKLISVMLSAVICIGLFAGVAYADVDAYTDVDEMATALNKLNILQGGGNDGYMLDSQLERSQAVTLIIRMLGKERLVQQNADELRYTKFDDVTSDAWYAPYVGYGTLNNIVAGDTETTFSPGQYVTEKAFVKMALCALDYEYAVDFSWSDVYQKAYEVGLLTDVSYSTRTQDKTNYMRADAVEVIYRSLNTFKKGTETKLAIALIDEGVFTSAEVAESGIFGASIDIEIEAINALGPDTVEVKLNENVWKLDQEDVSIYETSKQDQPLDVKSVAFTDDKIQIVTAGQFAGRSYTVSIESIMNSAGGISTNLTGKFSGYTPKQTTSDFFMINKIEQASGKVIDVYFTHPLDVVSENPAYYDLLKNGSPVVTGASQGIVVKRLNSVDNAVSLYFTDYVFELGEVYTLKIDGRLTSKYGVKLGESFGETKDFVISIEETNQLQVAYVEALTSNTVRIVFNREVDSSWASRRINYSIYDKDDKAIDVTKAVVTESGSDSGKEVTLSLGGSLYKTRDYNVKIEYIPDVYKQSYIENKTFPFSGKYEGKNELSAPNAISEFNNSVMLIFNKPLDSEKASNNSSYSIRGKSDLTFNVVPEKVYYFEQDGMYAVKLFLPAGKALSDSKQYIAYAYDMKDSLGNVFIGSLRAEFTGGSIEEHKPLIVDAVTISKDAVKIEFNTEIAFNPTNISAANYTLESVKSGQITRMVPFAVNYVDAKTLVLRFDELDATAEYHLKFRSITDYSGLYTRTDSDDYNSAYVRWGE